MLQCIGENLGQHVYKFELKLKKQEEFDSWRLPGLVYRSTSFKRSFADFQRTKEDTKPTTLHCLVNIEMLDLSYNNIERLDPVPVSFRKNVITKLVFYIRILNKSSK